MRAHPPPCGPRLLSVTLQESPMTALPIGLAQLTRLAAHVVEPWRVFFSESGFREGSGPRWTQQLSLRALSLRTDPFSSC